LARHERVVPLKRAGAGQAAAPLKIWFVPSNSSHVGKFRLLMQALRGRGDDVRLIDVDAALPATLAARSQIEAAGFPHERMPASRFDPDAHWLRQIAQRRHLERSFTSVLERIQADVLVFGFDSFVSGRTFVRVAKAMGFATILIPDGLVVPGNDRYDPGFLAAARDALADAWQRAFRAGGARGLSGVDGILVMNPMGRDTLIGLGVPAANIHVVGSPEYDDLAARLRAAVDRDVVQIVRHRLGLSGERPVILFAHQVLDGTEREMIRAMVMGVRRCGAVLLVKFHPRGRQRPEEWRAWADQEGFGSDDLRFASSECTSIEALLVSSACVTAYSTVALEAFVCDRPLVLIHFANVPYDLPYGRKYGAAIDAHSPRELEAALVAVLTDTETRRTLHAGRERAMDGELGGLDGRSAVRMIAAIDATRAAAGSGRSLIHRAGTEGK